MRILATGPALLDSHESALQQLGFEIDYVADTLSESDLISHLHDADAYIFGGDEVATAAALQTTSRLRVIAFLGTGYAELIDADAATKRGIAIANTPGANAAAVAEATIGLMLALQRQFVALNEQTKAGTGRPIKLRNISRRRLGIVGLGSVGAKVAAYARRGFDMDVVYAGPNPKPEAERTLGVQRLSLEDLLRTSDFVSLHCPGATTEGLVGRRELSLMKRSAFLLNLAKPEVVEGRAVIDALTAQTIAGAGYDGYYTKPTELQQQFLALPNDRLIVLPRTAWLTEESFETMLSMAIANIRAFFEGKRPPNLVNPQYTEYRPAKR